MIWRLNLLLLTEKEFRDFIKTQISPYFDTNDNWETEQDIVPKDINDRFLQFYKKKI